MFRRGIFFLNFFEKIENSGENFLIERILLVSFLRFAFYNAMALCLTEKLFFNCLTYYLIFFINFKQKRTGKTWFSISIFKISFANCVCFLLFLDEDPRYEMSLKADDNAIYKYKMQSFDKPKKHKSGSSNDSTKKDKTATKEKKK